MSRELPHHSVCTWNANKGDDAMPIAADKSQRKNGQ